MLPRISKAFVFACLAWAGEWKTLPAQTPVADAKPQFEVASVKAAEAMGGDRGIAMMRMRQMMPVGMIPMPDAGRVRIQGLSLRELVAAAYRVRIDQVSGPPWMEEQRFDIEAKLPQGADKDQAHEMLQALLAERFGLQLHRESKELAGFVLVVGKHGSRLEEADANAVPAAPLSKEELEARNKEQMQKMMAQMQERKAAGMGGGSHSSFKSITTAQLAARLIPLAGGPVEDRTGLTGKYNVALDTYPGSAEWPGVTIFDAVEKLGLKLENRKTAVELLVVDKVSKTPTEN